MLDVDGYDFRYETSSITMGKASLLSTVRLLYARICKINDYKHVILRWIPESNVQSYMIRFQKAINWQQRDSSGMDNRGTHYNYQRNYS
jgi:hypothetical protein